MIDLSLQNKVAQVARNASTQHNLIDLKSLWQLLANISSQSFHTNLRATNTEYSYGAIPLEESPGIALNTPADAGPVVGIDGSQIYPSPLHPVRWAYIQALAYSPSLPIIHEAEFLSLEPTKAVDSDDQEWFEDKASIDFLRTLLELKVALKIVDAHRDYTILMDYPLLPWVARSDPSYSKRIKQYIDMIDKLKGHRIAGIVSAPKSQLLINLIALADKLNGGHNKFPEVSDTVLACAGLKPGQRSAIFKYAGSRNEVFLSRGIEICFFFILIRDRDVVRVEIPDWVARDASCVGLIHASILKDSSALGYSYALAKAHQEVAISLEIANSLHAVETRENISSGGPLYGAAKMRAKGLI
jgi:hypothetical protein